MSLAVRKLSDEKWEPWIGEDYKDASSLMMVHKTDAAAVSCRIIKLEPRGYTEMHSHPRVHHVLSLQGVVDLETDTDRVALGSLVTVRVDANVPHKFINRGNETALILVLNIFTE